MSLFRSRLRHPTGTTRTGSLVKSSQSFGGGNSRTAASHQVSSFNSPQQNDQDAFHFRKFLPTGRRAQNALNRRIYYYDPVCGGAVDLRRLLPWGEFDLVDLKDPKLQELYGSCVFDGLNYVQNMPLIGGEYQVIGRCTTHRIFNTSKGYWDQLIIHNDDYVDVFPPLFSGVTPKVNLRPPEAWRNFAQSKDPRDIRVRETLPNSFLNLLVSGQTIPLDPLNTSYSSRQLSPNEYLGHSLFERIIHVILYEQSILASTMQSALRKMGRILMVTVGDENWQPSSEELMDINYMFTEAERDPVSSVLVVPPGIDTQEVGNTHGDTNKLPDEIGWINEVKMLGLGVSESFLTGDASINQYEQGLSIGVESLKSFRDKLTNDYIMDTLQDLAKIWQAYKVTPAEMSHGIRVKDDERELILPRVQWQRSLQPVGDEAMLDVLQRAEEKGVPIPLRAWALHAGLDFDEFLQQMPQDVADRKNVFNNWTAQKPKSDDDGVFGSLKTWDSDHRFAGVTKKDFEAVRRDPTMLERLPENQRATLSYLLDRSGGSRCHLPQGQAARIANALTAVNNPQDADTLTELYRLQTRTSESEPVMTDALKKAGQEKPSVEELLNAAQTQAKANGD